MHHHRHHHQEPLHHARPPHPLLAAAALAPLWPSSSPCAAPAGRRADDLRRHQAAGPGRASFDQAVLDANANPGRDTIIFDLGGVGIGGVFAPVDRPVRITDAVVIDGCSRRRRPPHRPRQCSSRPGRRRPRSSSMPPMSPCRAFSIPGAARPVDVTAARRSLRLPQRGADAGPASRSGSPEPRTWSSEAPVRLVHHRFPAYGGVILIDTAGFELVDTIGARARAHPRQVHLPRDRPRDRRAGHATARPLPGGPRSRTASPDPAGRCGDGHRSRSVRGRLPQPLRVAGASWRPTGATSTSAPPASTPSCSTTSGVPVPRSGSRAHRPTSTTPRSAAARWGDRRRCRCVRHHHRPERRRRQPRGRHPSGGHARPWNVRITGNLIGYRSGLDIIVPSRTATMTAGSRSTPPTASGSTATSSAPTPVAASR